MNLHEAPMILFTTLAQMCVGAFLVLGVIQLVGTTRFSARVVDRFTDYTLFAIGPAMILGLAVSMLHMHDITNTLNVLRHWDSSWLSREIIFGSAFAGVGFLFFLLQWRKIGSTLLRQGVAVVAALLGVGLLVSMASIYTSLVTVPAWRTWFTPLQFFATAVLLGSLLVCAALVLLARREPRLPERWRPVERQAAAGASTPDAEAHDAARLASDAVRGLLLTAVLTAGILLVATPIYLAQLATAGDIAARSAQVYTGGLVVLRFALLVLGAVLLGFLAIRLASPERVLRSRLAGLLVAAFTVALVGELIGRTLFYEAMQRVGI